MNSILKRHGLKTTPIREHLLDIIQSASIALSQSEIEKLYSNQLDRVTIYRNLKLFEEKGILHRIVDDTGTTKFALCHDTCSQHQHNDQHVHFNCSQCNNTYCLDVWTESQTNLPEGFLIEDLKINIKGICKKCNSSTKN